MKTNMRRRLVKRLSIIILLLVLIAGTAVLAFAGDYSAETLSAGRFERTSEVKSVKETSYGTKDYTVDGKCVEQRTRFSRADIPFWLGWGYKIFGPGKQVDYVFRCIHPHAPNWGKNADTPFDYHMTATIGKRSYRTMNILKQGNYVSGKWIYQIIVQGEVIASQEFYFE